MDSPISRWVRNVDMHTKILNYVYSLYRPSQQYAYLANIGYWGNPDPYLGAVTPDFISCGTRGDVQIIDVKSFYRDDTKQFDYNCEDVVKTLEEKYEKYNALTPLDIIPYFNIHKAEREPRTVEITFILPKEVFDECSSSIQMKMRNLIIWVVDFGNVPPVFRKVLGTHSQPALETTVQEISLKSDLEILVRYFRNSNMRDIKRCFSMYLMHSCIHDQAVTFAFDEIDEIMTDSRPPLLGHLSKREREDFWRKCLRFLVDVAKVVKPSRRGPNYYTWERSILRSPYYRERTLERIEKSLGGRQHEYP